MVLGFQILKVDQNIVMMKWKQALFHTISTILILSAKLMQRYEGHKIQCRTGNSQVTAKVYTYWIHDVYV